MASIPSLITEALTQLTELDLESMSGDSGGLVKTAEDEAARVLIALSGKEATMKDLCSSTEGLKMLFTLVSEVG